MFEWEELPYFYKKSVEFIRESTNGRSEITIPEFKATMGRSMHVKKEDWFEPAKDMEKMGILKVNGNKRSIAMLYPENKAKTN